MSRSVFGVPPSPDPAVPPGGGSGPVDAVGEHSFAFCTKHKSGQPTLWPAPFLRALNQRTYPGPIFLSFSPPGKNKSTMQFVCTPGYIHGRGVSVLKCPGVNWGYFSALGGMYLQPSPWNVTPTCDLRQTRAVGVCWGDSCSSYVVSAQSGELLPCSPVGNKATKTPFHWNCSHFRKVPSSSTNLEVTYFPNLVVC
ncbi:hypothetical protein HJG60_009338 [Phyllostomus discolor]|uniref:Uncharacterized protein n=1 Tax=Phyllostomus discolor TaxID=89673 RepID=A0A833Y8T7_9CHIR|nr:hypothetical protein HJG60_009338 [Phyllostomus discolor]